MRLAAGTALLTSAVLVCSLPRIGHAQGGTPGVEDMIRALTPPTKTRSLGAAGGLTRNLQPMLDLTIHFDFDSAAIREDSKKSLQNLAAALNDRRLAAYRFQIQGHTDAQDTAAYNDILSTRRAQAVVGFLQAEGIALDRLNAVGMGFRELLDTVDPKSPKNRRVRVLTQP